MNRVLLALLVVAFLLAATVPALASQFEGNSPISSCSRCWRVGV